jgi:dGTP triphosphohydrolase
MFEENYLHDIPRDIQEMIMDISKRRYCDIYISFWNNYSNTKDSFISKRMNRNILKYSQTIKNVEIDSEQYLNIESYASATLKSHITQLVSNLKKAAIRKILYDNDIYDAKITYKKKYASDTGIIDDYEKALLIEIIYYNYYYKVFIIAHDVRDI